MSPLISKSARLGLTLAFFMSLLSLAPVRAEFDPSLYNMSYGEQAIDSSGSMPLVGKDLGVNVWVQGDELRFLVASPNALKPDGRQMKLGIVRLKFSPSIFSQDFKQELKLKESEIIVSGKTASGEPAQVTLWGSRKDHVIHAELDSEQAVEVTVSYETWNDAYQASIVDNGVQWFSRYPQKPELDENDPVDLISKLTIGGRLMAPGLIDAGVSKGSYYELPTTITSVKTKAPVKQLDLICALRMEQEDSVEAWKQGLEAGLKRAAAEAETDRAEALAWWQQFWDRSHIVIARDEATPLRYDETWQVGRNYQLGRYMLAANTTGRTMTLFNGGLFNFGANGSHIGITNSGVMDYQGNPDLRNWDNCHFMGQNQRLIHWPLLRSGDFDMLKVGTDFYADRFAVAQERSKRFFNIEDGAYYPESLDSRGEDALGANEQGLTEFSHLSNHLLTGFEFALMMLETQKYTNTTIKGYAAPALGQIKFFDARNQNNYKEKTGEPLRDGKLVIYPNSARETYHGCTNNVDMIAALTRLTNELLLLGDDQISAADRTYLEEFKKRIPDYTYGEADGQRFLKVAESYEDIFANGNMEFPHMDVLFPFGIYSLGRTDEPTMEILRKTWEVSAVNADIQRQNHCWYVTAVHRARMGMTKDAAELTLARFHENHVGKFPLFYSPVFLEGHTFCQAPCTDGIGSSMIGLQEMLMQTDGKRILIAPAWPKEWSVNFKLHAPYETVVEGSIEDGKVKISKVTPEERRKDVEIFEVKEAGLQIPLIMINATASSEINASTNAARAFDGSAGAKWQTAKTETEGWVQAELAIPQEIKRAVVATRTIPNTMNYELQVQSEKGGPWKTVGKGETILKSTSIEFDAVKAIAVRLKVKSETPGINVNEISVYAE